jgi:hypothetical protein
VPTDRARPGARASVPGVMRWLCALVVGGILSGFAFLLLTGRYIKEGPVVVTVTRTHGLHAGDVFVIGGWTVAMVALLVLTTRSQRTVRA